MLTLSATRASSEGETTGGSATPARPGLGGCGLVGDDLRPNLRKVLGHGPRAAYIVYYLPTLGIPPPCLPGYTLPTIPLLT